MTSPSARRVLEVAPHRGAAARRRRAARRSLKATRLLPDAPVPSGTEVRRNGHRDVRRAATERRCAAWPRCSPRARERVSKPQPRRMSWERMRDEQRARGDVKGNAFERERCAARARRRRRRRRTRRRRTARCTARSLNALQEPARDPALVQRHRAHEQDEAELLLRRARRRGSSPLAECRRGVRRRLRASRAARHPHALQRNPPPGDVRRQFLKQAAAQDVDDGEENGGDAKGVGMVSSTRARLSHNHATTAARAADAAREGATCPMKEFEAQGARRHLGMRRAP